MPYIDMLVDSITKYSLFSFMDRYLGYNQIKMVSKDMEKTTFVTNVGNILLQSNVIWGKKCLNYLS